MKRKGDNTMKNRKRIKRTVQSFSTFFTVAGVAMLTVFGLELFINRASNPFVMYVSLFVSVALAVVAVILDGVADVLTEKERHEQSAAYQAWQKWQLWVEEKRMRMNINIK